MAIFKTDDGRYVISSHDVWLPGCYEDERAARYAFRLSDQQLQELQDETNAREPRIQDRTITYEMLRQKKRDGA